MPPSSCEGGIFLNNTNKMNKSKLFPILLFAYVLSLAFQDFMHLPGLFRKVQLPEILFLSLLAAFPLNYLRDYQFNKIDRLLMSILGIYWLANIVSSVLSGEKSAVFESLGRLYLLILFGMAVLYFAQLSKVTLRRQVATASCTLGVLLALTGLIGLVAQLSGYSNMLVGISEDYPYFGTVYRLQGFTHTPAMLVSLLIFTGIITFTEGTSHFNFRTLISALITMVIVAFLTFSRSAMFLMWGLLLMAIFKKRGFSQRILRVSAVVLALFMTIVTHTIVISKTNPSLPILYSSSFTSNKILFEKGDWLILETSYLAIKRASMAIWQTQPLVGIGTGNFVNGLKEQQKQSVYPQKLPLFEAHSTYIGTLVENGPFAVAAILLFFGLLWQRIDQLDNLKTDNFLVALLICLAVVFIENIALDTMNFRHYWLLYALIWAYPKISKMDKTAVS
jgi:hypothetical protein